MLIFIKCLLAVFATRGYDLGSVDRVRAFGIAQGVSREHAQEPASAGHSWSGIIRIFRLVAVVSFLEQLAASNCCIKRVCKGCGINLKLG